MQDNCNFDLPPPNWSRCYDRTTEENHQNEGVFLALFEGDLRSIGI